MQMIFMVMSEVFFGKIFNLSISAAADDDGELFLLNVLPTNG